MGRSPRRRNRSRCFCTFKREALDCFTVAMDVSNPVTCNLSQPTEPDKEGKIHALETAGIEFVDDNGGGGGCTIAIGEERKAGVCPVHRNAPAVRQDRCTNRLKVDAMDISPIKNQRDYRKVLKAIEGLMSAKRNTPEGDRLDVLVTLVEAWERKHYPMDLPDPVEAIKYHMDQNGLQPRDLIPFIGSRTACTR